VKGWSGLSSGPWELFLLEACASGVVTLWPLWAGATSTIRVIWTECLWKLIPNEVNLFYAYKITQNSGVLEFHMKLVISPNLRYQLETWIK
jgi:hypothetical protein